MRDSGRRCERVALVIGVMLWTVGDLYTTWIAIGAGAIEGNPAARALLASHGFGGVTALKLVIVALVIGHWAACTRGVRWLEASDELDDEPRYVRAIARYGTLVHPVTLCVLGGALTAWNTLVYVGLR